MCGIAGIIDYSRQLRCEDVIAEMVHRISHRGPDGHGSIVRDGVALGHSRLSIIDLAGGHQPMSSANDKVQLTFNGEIYNFRELRSQLSKLGHSFQTDSDTEVVLNAYLQWGKTCVERFEGMFAFAIADFTRNELFAARDPFGIKPFLYRITGSSFAFASEHQAFWALPDWQGEIDLCSIDLYLRFQYIPAPRTAFRGVFKLPAGHRMTVRLGEPHQKIERYWEPEFTGKSKATGAALIDELDASLQDSVSRHLVSDVPFGALLSGGIDSSLVVGYMSELLDAPVKTFSIGFEDESVNELEYARLVAKKYATEHHEEIVRFDALNILPELVRHYGEPFGDQSAIPTWHVCQLARSKVPMVLSGDGGDELLAGYGTYGNWLRRMDYLRSRPEQGWKSFIRPLAKSMMPGRYPEPQLPEKSPDHWMQCVIRFTEQEREQLWRPELRFLADQSCGEFIEAFEAGKNCRDVNRAQRCDLETFLPEDILCKVDIASMRFGLEVRPPMLDRRFFKTVRKISPQTLYARDADGQNYCGKMPLKQLAAKKLGQDFAFRPKQGFVMPLQSWFERSTREASEIRDRLTDPASSIAGWFDQAQVHDQLDRSRVVNVWLLLVLEEWLCQQRCSSKLVGT
jgi:asparagine synthase (glutamine-hydrolysing)